MFILGNIENYSHFLEWISSNSTGSAISLFTPWYYHHLSLTSLKSPQCCHGQYCTFLPTMLCLLESLAFKPLISKKKLQQEFKGLRVKRYLYTCFVLLYRSCRSYGSDSESDRSYSHHRSPSESSRYSWKCPLFFIWIISYV